MAWGKGRHEGCIRWGEVRRKKGCDVDGGVGFVVGMLMGSRVHSRQEAACTSRLVGWGWAEGGRAAAEECSESTCKGRGSERSGHGGWVGCGFGAGWLVGVAVGPPAKEAGRRNWREACGSGLASGVSRCGVVGCKGARAGGCVASYRAATQRGAGVAGKKRQGVPAVREARVNMTRSVAVLRQEGAPERGFGDSTMGVGRRGGGPRFTEGAAPAAAGSGLGG